MTTRRISSLIGLMLLSLSIASTATAQDKKTFPGVMCQAQDNTHAISRHNRAAAMTNTSTTTQTWFCPIVRDDPFNSLLSAQLVSSRGVSCTLISRADTSEIVDSKEYSAYHYIWVPYEGVVWTYQGVSSAQNGFYVFRCNVPPGEQVVSYLIEESQAYR